MYYWDIKKIEKIRIGLLSLLWTAFGLSTILIILGNRSAIAVMPPLIGFLRVTRNSFKKHKAQKNDPDLAPKVKLNESSLYYNEGKNKYEIEIPYSNIKNIKFQSIFGINRILLDLPENQALSLWNIEKSKALWLKISEKM